MSPLCTSRGSPAWAVLPAVVSLHIPGIVATWTEHRVTSERVTMRRGHRYVLDFDLDCRLDFHLGSISFGLVWFVCDVARKCEFPLFHQIHELKSGVRCHRRLEVGCFRG